MPVETPKNDDVEAWFEGTLLGRVIMTTHNNPKFPDTLQEYTDAVTSEGGK